MFIYFRFIVVKTLTDEKPDSGHRHSRSNLERQYHRFLPHNAYILLDIFPSG
jgi:hypothetical protein